MKRLFNKNWLKDLLISVLTIMVMFNTYNLYLLNRSEPVSKQGLQEIINNSKAISELQYVPVDKMKANVVVLSGKGMGSGSVIQTSFNKSLILTAAHVVSSHNKATDKHTVSKKLSIRFKNTKEYTAIVEKIDYKLDVAVLRIGKKLNVTPIKIAKREPKLGEVVWAISNPGGTYGIINSGIFSTPSKNNSIVSIAGYFGSSGGMCLNNKGEQIGIISTVHTARVSKFVTSLTVYNGVTRTKSLNRFLKGVL